MASVRQCGTDPELTIRKLLHQAGFRFRLRNHLLPGSPDIVLPRWQTVILVHGCFWHGHDCSLFRLPGTRTEWWRTKIASNVARDQRVVEALLNTGWRVITIWQCILKGTALLQAIQGDSAMVDLRGLLAADKKSLE
jgi:DNA mismatch endonuclease, patch repair protein